MNFEKKLYISNITIKNIRSSYGNKPQSLNGTVPSSWRKQS